MDYVKMDKPTCRMVGAPCGHHGQYTFYKALRICGQYEKILAIGDFFFVRIWQDSELVSIGELQLLWTDRVSDQTLVSLRLYFLPENTPDGRHLHGEDEVLAINEKIVIKAEDLMTWICDGTGWRWGLKAVWRGACAPSTEITTTSPLHCSKLDFSDVDKEKSAMEEVESDSPGVVVFSYPRYCRYRALLSRLEGIQADWLRDSLVAALGGYAAPTCNTRILYCKDTFEYPELEGHEFVCNHLAPKLKGRPRGRRKRRQSHSSDRNSDSDSDGQASTPRSHIPQTTTPQTPRRPSLRNGTEKTSGDEKEDQYKPKKTVESLQDRTFLAQLRAFYKQRNETSKLTQNLKDLSLRALYECVCSIGGYEAACRDKSWRFVRDLCGYHTPASARRLYEKILLPFENYKRNNGLKPSPFKYDYKMTKDSIHTMHVADSPLRESNTTNAIKDKQLRTPSPKKEPNYYQPADLTITNPDPDPDPDLHTTNKPAEQLNQEFLDSLPPKTEDHKYKISIKPIDKLHSENNFNINSNNDISVGHKFGDEFYKLHADLSVKCVGEENKDGGLSDKLETKFLTNSYRNIPTSDALSNLSTLTQKYATALSNGTAHADPSDLKSGRRASGAVPGAARSSLRSVRVKPAANRERHSSLHNSVPIPPLPLRPNSASISPPVCTNFGINYPVPPPNPPTAPTNDNQSDDEIIEVPYKPKTPEIIDLDEYPESPQSVKKKKLDILKERGLEVTAIPNYPVLNNPLTSSLLNPNPVLLHPSMQHQILTQAQLFQMYNMMPQTYSTNGVPPPKIIQGNSIFGTSGPEKTVYGNPKDPFMPAPHILQGTPIKPARNLQNTTPQNILDLTCKSPTLSVTTKPAVEIVKIPNNPSTSPNISNPQNLTRNYTLIDGKAVVGSNLEITLVNPKPSSKTQQKTPQKRSSNGKFMSAKTPSPPTSNNAFTNKSIQQTSRAPNLVVPIYPAQELNPNPNLLPNTYKNHNVDKNLAGQVSPFVDPMYMNALYSSLAGQLDQRQLAVYRELMANQFRGYSGMLASMGGTITNTPTTKN